MILTWQDVCVHIQYYVGICNITIPTSSTAASSAVIASESMAMEPSSSESMAESSSGKIMTVTYVATYILS